MTQELMKKAKACQSSQEIQALAKEMGYELTEEQARDYLAKLNPGNGEIADEELENVSGGGCGVDPCEVCGCDKVRVERVPYYDSGFMKDAWVCANCGAFWRWK